jgi:hypothetical protein
MRSGVGGIVVRLGFFLLPLGAAAWAGCSDDPEAGPVAPDAAPDAPDVSQVPVEDAGGDAGRDCSEDEDPDGLMRHLECAGLYEDIAAKTVKPSARPYTPALSFWADGAEKQRWVDLPSGEKIDITSFDEWAFPNGTKLWKEFSLDGKRIETRLYAKGQDGRWKHTSYRWNDAETDAVRVGGGDTVARDGGPPYVIPDTFQCNQCHDGREEPVLGFDAVSLGLPGAEGVTLAVLAAEDRLSAAPPATALTIPDDGTGAATAAFGWLHANCGSCHNPSAGAGAFFTGLYFHIRPSQLLADGGVASGSDLDAVQTSCGVTSTRSDDAGVPYLRVDPGAPEASAVAILAGRRAAGEPSSAVQMPPLVTRRVDADGHALLSAWIGALTECPPPP